MKYVFKMMRVKSLAALLAMLGVVTPALPGKLLAADRPLQKINVAYSSISGNQAALWVTQEKGFFRKYGMEVQAVLIESGTTTAQALVAGDISFANVAGPAVIQSSLRGADLVIIAGVLNTLVFQIYTDKNISRPDQLKGKSVSVTRFGSATDFAIRYALEKYGLDPNKDVAILQLGNHPAQLAALEAGRVQGAMLSMPTSLRAKKAGFPMLADLQMLGLEYQHTSIATSRALLKSKPELARDFLRAYIEGIHYAKTHRKETIEVLAKYLRVDDKEVLEETYETLVTTLMPEKPYPTIKGVQTILREFGTKDPAARSARPEQFVDASLVKELDSSGFIDRLYKPAVAIAKTAPAKEAVAAPAPSKEKPVQVAESKTKPVGTEEKAKPVAKQVPAAASEKAPAPATKSAAQQYTVKPGDTLSKLAEQYYSSAGKWDKIYEANRDTLKNPNYIYIGMKLMIPADDKAS
jgi:NitT/TauT family transport system substrate-binding protein